MATRWAGLGDFMTDAQDLLDTGDRGHLTGGASDERRGGETGRRGLCVSKGGRRHLPSPRRGGGKREKRARERCMSGRRGFVFLFTELAARNPRKSAKNPSLQRIFHRGDRTQEKTKTRLSRGGKILQRR